MKNQFLYIKSYYFGINNEKSPMVDLKLHRIRRQVRKFFKMRRFLRTLSVFDTDELISVASKMVYIHG